MITKSIVMETLKYKVIKSETQYDKYCRQLEELLNNGPKTKGCTK